MSMQPSDSDRSEPVQFEQELRRVLYRFDCPDAHTLGEYQLDLLEPEQRRMVAGHASECDDCRAELQTLRSFLAEPISVPESLGSRARRIVASLFTPRADLAYGGLRGSVDNATRIFAAGDVTVSISSGERPGSLFGLVVGPDASEGAALKLVPREGAPTLAVLDDLGNFEFLDVSPGRYALEIELSDGVVVIEELRVD